MSSRWETTRRFNASSQVRNSFKIGRAERRGFSSLQPVADRPLDQTRLREMVGQNFGLCLHDFRELLFQGARDGSVKVPTAAYQEAGVSSVPYKSVFEAIDRVRNLPSPENQFRSN